MPTSPLVRRRFLEILPPQLSGTILELGAGWGTLAFPLADKYPQCQVVAYENSWVPYLFCRLRLLLSPRKNLSFRRCSFYGADFNGATLAVCYLFPGGMRRLAGKFERDLPSGALIATHTFALPGWTPVAAADAGDMYHTRIYLYKKNGLQ